MKPLRSFLQNRYSVNFSAKPLTTTAYLGKSLFFSKNAQH